MAKVQQSQLFLDFYSKVSEIILNECMQERRNNCLESVFHYINPTHAVHAFGEVYCAFVTAVT